MDGRKNGAWSPVKEEPIVSDDELNGDDLEERMGYINSDSSEDLNNPNQPLLSQNDQSSGAFFMKLIVASWILLTLLAFVYRRELAALVRKLAIKAAEQGNLLYLYYILIFTLTVPLFMSIEVFVVSAGFVFSHIHGQWIGVVISVLTSFVGYVASMIICFFVSRYLIYSFVNRRLRRHRYYSAIMRATERDGFKIVTIIRFSPILPAALCSYIFGTTNVSFWNFTLGSVGSLPSLVFLSYLGSLLEDLASNDKIHGFRTALYITTSLVVSLMGMFYATKLTQRHLPETAED
ncbi:conserved hypothetical protein [Theileria equi strain WA]|uniref:VTT domain-containing protein n=1 Tax=Theileria equi strain WA TaxID=1537102 RepID=L1LGW0_THEEQ|nr:conserved hypothetical protein [Theileria equi strain WA]EKX74358.1 conserved hypothetical protein [Theileria equi strain WA]|eukprot:XP_004833810.1 conserved hypothetical protein [Theileria equi strain WA]